MRLLFIGDIVGKGGRKAVVELASTLRSELGCSMCVANGENMANGSGINAKCVLDISSPNAVDVITVGDHVWDQKGFEIEIKSLKNVLRPSNLNPVQPGRGWGVFRNPSCGEIAVISLMGRVFMKDSSACPFGEADRILKEIPPTVKTIVVDFHAEATSEKSAMARHLDGRVTAVIGTHTHVQTADERILPGGTAFISDVGMVGADESILGRGIEAATKKFVTGMPSRLDVVETGLFRLDAVTIDYDANTGRATAIQRVQRRIQI